MPKRSPIPCLLFLPVIIVTLACGQTVMQQSTLPSTATSTPSATKLILQTPTSGINDSGTLTALPPGPSIERTRIILEAYFDAYNNHDVAGILEILSTTFQYGDCDYQNHVDLVLKDYEELKQWLSSRFDLHDHFEVVEMTIAPAEGSPPISPRMAAVEVIRTSDILPSDGRRSLFKIVMDEAGDHISFLNTEGNILCRKGAY
jgi:hypothetical protein